MKSDYSYRKFEDPPSPQGENNLAEALSAG